MQTASWTRIHWALVLIMLILTGCGGGGFTPPQPPLQQIPGAIQGTIVDSSGNPLSNVSVALSSGRTTISNGSGIFEFRDVNAGTYSISCHKDGFLDYSQSDIKVEAGKTNHLRSITLLLDLSNLGNISGQVVDAIYGNGVTGAIIKIWPIDDTTGDPLYETTSDSDGNYRFEGIPGDTYIARIIAVGYISEHKDDIYTLLCVPGETRANQNLVIVPLLNEGEIRIVLTWGELPQDLDAHLTGPKVIQDSSISGDRFHIYWPSYYRTYDYNNIVFAKIDLDMGEGYGPETISVHQGINGTYSFFVHNFSYEDTNPNNTMRGDPLGLAKSNATVKIYRVEEGLVLIATYNVPNLQGNLWKVFDITYVDGETSITPYNTFEFINDVNNIN